MAVLRRQEEFEQLGTLVEDAVESSNGDIELLKQEFGTFKDGVEGATEGIKSLVARVLATEEENYDTVLAEANLSSVIVRPSGISSVCIPLAMCSPRGFRRRAGVQSGGWSAAGEADEICGAVRGQGGGVPQGPAVGVAGHQRDAGADDDDPRHRCQDDKVISVPHGAGVFGLAEWRVDVGPPRSNLA
eukprot:COSAG04_NODE_203_length_20431_cov_12.598269_3_plen_188_part_00